MKLSLAISAFSVCFGLATMASAQETLASAHAEDPEAAVAHRAPPAHRGFQMALRTGFSLPFGKVGKINDVTPELSMSDYTTGQVPLFIEIGGKPIKHLFVGGYLGIGFGGTAGNTSDDCDDADVDCISVSTRIGVEVQYHILPHHDINPWVGYGIGVETSSLAITKGDEDGNISYGGFEFARLSAGADFRVSRVFGVGPFADFSIGQYYTYRIDAPVFGDSDGDLEDTAIHEWLTVGARFVFFP